MRRLATLLITAGVALAGCGSLAAPGGAGFAPRRAALASQGAGRSGSVGLPRLHPQAVQPVAGALPAAGAAAAQGAAGDGAQAAGAPGSGGASGSVGATGASGPLPQPVSNAQIRRELAQSGIAAASDHAILTSQGLAIPPLDAPPAVVEVIDAGNEIAHLPYRFGGGHVSFIDTAYDCSGSLSFVLGSAGLLDQTMTSGQLEHWGDPGPGRWITIFANAGHTFAYIAGLRFDTVALAQTGSRWSDTPADEGDLSSFVARHPPGL